MVSVHEVGCASRVPTRPPSVFRAAPPLCQSRDKSRAATQQWGSGCGGYDEARMAVGGMCYEEQLEKPMLRNP